MPVSKRDKKVSLTKTTKKGMPLKKRLVEDIRSNLEKYHSLYVFTVHNMRGGPLQDVREEWKGSRLFFAKRKVMAIALGRTEAEEAEKDLHKLTKQLVGQCGILFTNEPKDYVLNWFKNYSKMDYAKSGFVATETVTLPSGPLPDFSFAIEPHLRTLGLPTKLEKGVIVLREDYVVCTEGAKLTPEQASVLKLLGKQMAEFKVALVCMWSKDGSFQKFKAQKDVNQLITSDKQSPKSETKNRKSKSPKAKELSKEGSENETLMEVIKDETLMEVIKDENLSGEEKDTEVSKKETNRQNLKKKTLKESEKAESQLYHDESEVHKIIGQVKESLSLEKTPRRSLRTSKPIIKDTPDQPKRSVKALTVSAKKTPLKATATPKTRASAARKGKQASQDVEMTD